MVGRSSQRSAYYINKVLVEMQNFACMHVCCTLEEDLSRLKYVMQGTIQRATKTTMYMWTQYATISTLHKQ